LFSDGQSRQLPYFAIRVGATNKLECSISGESNESHASGGESWNGIIGRASLTLPCRERSEQIRDCLAWFARDVVIHLSTPRGLEQSNGGAWGVRDVCQGPVEFLLGHDRGDVVKEILRAL